MNFKTPILALLLAAGVPVAFAQSTHGHDHGGHAMQMSPASGVPAFVEGEVKELDRDSAKVTLKHGPIGNIGMPAMTMTFSVKDPGQLNGIKAGDAIRFKAEKAEGGFLVTQLVRK